MNERFREILLELKKSGIRQKDIAARLGVTEAAVSAWKSDKRTITDMSLKAFCREFNINEKWLRTGEGKMFIQSEIDTYKRASNLLSNDYFIRNMIIEYYKLNDDDRALLREFVNRLSGRNYSK